MAPEPASTHRTGFVSLIGRPNAGKSTLLNAIVGTKLAIVSDKPQTTRTRILGVKNYPHGQAVFIDTPGIHRPLHRLNVRMVDMALETLQRVDVLGLVVDATERTGRGDRFLLERLARVQVPVVVVLNKIDLIAKPRLLPILEWYGAQRAFEGLVPVSALTGDGVGELEALLLGLLPPGEALYPADYLTDQPERFFVAEAVREKILRYTRAELPFASAVVVDQFDEPDAGGPLRVYCSIVVEQESQKPILIGRRGAMLKRIGSEARRDLERFFNTRVFLSLHVKVRADWREDERVLDQIGMPRPRRSHPSRR